MEIRARLDKNESPVDVPEIIKHRIMELGLMTEFNRYDGSHRAGLLKALAGANGVSPQSVLITNGADEAISITATAFGGPGVSVIIPSPTFVSYPVAAKWSRSETVHVPRLLPDFRMDVDRMVEEASKAHTQNPGGSYSSLLYVCRPNNPTGDLCEEEDVKRLLEVPGAMVALDEAYFEFSQDSLVDWTQTYKNLVVIRTFSKAYCIAGLRVGYVLAHPETIEILENNKLVYNVNVFSQAAALVALNDRAYFMRWAQETRTSTQALARALAALSEVSVFPTYTNFVLFRTPYPAESVKSALLDRGILVTTYPFEPMLEKHIRVSVGTDEENAAFLKELEHALKTLAC